MIDLHSHTDASDGTDTPEQLIANAVALGLEALAITDHDTFAGYEAALPIARDRGLDLVRGIELSTKHNGKTVHLLGYFLHKAPRAGFAAWVTTQLASRRDRNARLAERLRSLGVDIQLEEVEALGHSITGRPHFARVLMNKGYVKSTDQAFREYLGEDARAYVDRDSISLVEAIDLVQAGGGLAVLAHPIRVHNEWAVMEEMAAHGIDGIEVIHSDHPAAMAERYRAFAISKGLLITGGSDYHGGNKPDVRLGTGRGGNVNVPLSVLDNLRRQAVHA